MAAVDLHAVVEAVTVAHGRVTLAGLLASLGHYREAECLLNGALTLSTKVLGPSHPVVAEVLDGYADLLCKTNRCSAGQQLRARSKAIATLGASHSYLWQ